MASAIDVRLCIRNIRTMELKQFTCLDRIRLVLIVAVGNNLNPFFNICFYILDCILFYVRHLYFTGILSGVLMGSIFCA